MSSYFNINDYVKITSKSILYPSYKGKYSGYYGFISRISGNRIGVTIDGETNEKSGYGVFWFYDNELKLTKEKVQNQEECFMDKNYHPVIINFISGSNTNVPYVYAAYEDYAEGDYVVVHTGHHGMAIAKVKAMGTEDDKVEYGREIICKIDMTAYNDRKARAKRKAELKGKMEAKVKELQETAIFEMLAKEDAGLAEMLKEFKELG